MSINSERAYVWAQFEYDQSPPGRILRKLQELYTRLSFPTNRVLINSNFAANYVRRHAQCVLAFFYIP